MSEKRGKNEIDRQIGVRGRSNERGREKYREGVRVKTADAERERERELSTERE